jgi:hypothetical protein
MPPEHQPVVQQATPLFLRYTADLIMQTPWMTIPYVRFGLPMKRKVVVKIAIPQSMTITSAGFWQGGFILPG